MAQDVDEQNQEQADAGEKKERFAAAKFLASRRGRPTLIIVSIAVLAAGFVGTWLYSALVGPDQTAQQRATEQVASRGGGDVETRSDGKVEADLTNPNLTDEAKEAARQYNEQANKDEDLHPTPTFENVSLVGGGQNDSGDDPSGLEPESGGDDQGGNGQDNQQTYSYTPPDKGSESNQRQNQRQGSGPNGEGLGLNGRVLTPENTTGVFGPDGERLPAGKPGRAGQEAWHGRPLTHEEVIERNKLRMEAAQNMMDMYSRPSEIASVSFVDEQQQSGNGSQSGSGGTSSGTNTMATPSAAPAQGGAMNAATSTTTANGGSQSGSGTGGGDGNSCQQPLVKAGEVVYANNDIALNTDHKGPVRITFLQGKLRGWTGMGSFELNELGAKMNVTVEKVISPEKGRVFDTTGYVLDPKTTLWATSSDVDYHLIYRYGGFGLATVLGAFQELAEARSVKSETTAVGETQTQYREPDGKQVTWRLLGNFGEAFQEVFADNINRPITVTLDPNERIGVLFEETVCGPQNNLSPIQSMRAEGRSDPVGG